MTNREQVASALVALAQGLREGKLNGDDARCVAEHLPNTWRAIAEEADETTGGLDQRAKGHTGIDARVVHRAVMGMVPHSARVSADNSFQIACALAAVLTAVLAVVVGS